MLKRKNCRNDGCKIKNCVNEIFKKKGMYMEDLELEETRRLVRERMRLRMRNGACCDEIEVKLWLPELTQRNVTIFCDKLLLDDIHAGKQGIIAITTRKEDLCHFSYWNIEDQSSGFKMKDYILGTERDELSSVILEVTPTYVKDELIVPENNREGFYRLGEARKTPVFTDRNSRRVSTSLYGQQFILNFTVGGEFRLYIDYYVQGDEDCKRIFERGFCCK